MFGFEEYDEELIVALQQQFGDAIRYEKRKNFDGLEILLMAIIPITAVTVAARCGVRRRNKKDNWDRWQNSY